MSFSADTRVLLASGAAIAIAALANGDMVLTTDPATGETSAQPVTALFAHLDLALADVTVTDPDGATAVVHTTQNHPFWVQTTREWVQAGDLQPGDELLTSDGSITTVVKVDQFLRGQVMYNLSVNQSHTYYVLAGDIPVLVHNRPDMGDEGYRNYLLRDQSGKPYYSGMFGPRDTEAGVQRRHGRNHNRFNPANGDTFDLQPGTRTYGESRLMEQRLAEQHGTIIGRDGDNYRGNRQNPLDDTKRPAYEEYERGLGGDGGC